MATFQRPAQLMKHWEKRASLTVHSLRDAHKELIQGGKEDHAQLTSGNVSDDELAAMGHPFGRVRSGDPSTGVRGVQNGATIKNLSVRAIKKGNVIRKGVLMPLPINKQTGDLRRSFFETSPSGPDLIVHMGFSVDYARDVLSPTGTKFMVARGFYSVDATSTSLAGLGAVAKRHRARKQGILNSARKRYLIP